MASLNTTKSHLAARNALGSRHMVGRRDIQLDAAGFCLVLKKPGRPSKIFPDDLTLSQLPRSPLDNPSPATRDGLPGGLIGRFERDGNVSARFEEQRHLHQGVADRHRFDEGAHTRFCLVSGQGQGFPDGALYSSSASISEIA